MSMTRFEEKMNDNAKGNQFNINDMQFLKILKWNKKKKTDG